MAGRRRNCTEQLDDESLPGGRWVAHYGSNVNHVVGRVGNYEWVQTNSSGSMYELVFDDDGSYVWSWASSLTMNGQKYQSHCTEKGRWELSGTQLVLTPDSQAAEYANGSGAQQKEDENLAERRYTLLDLTLETLDAPKKQFPGLMMHGPKPVWDTGSSDPLALTLQRLSL